MQQTAITFAGLALAGTLCVSAAEKTTSYAPPLTLCKRQYAV
jgi:hypothetical protein